MNTRPRISICIPTYNREPFLGELLESIISQADPTQVEIAIADNASTDQTTAMVEQFRAQYPNITYFRWPENMGADRNYLKCVDIASGEFCWLMGSDDVVPAGAVQRMLSLLGSEDICLVGRTECTFHLKKIQDRRWLDDAEPSQRFDFTRRDEILRYLEACRSLGGVFSYLSSIIVRREKWNAIPFDEQFIGTAYSHVYVLLSMVMAGACLAYHVEPLVISRAGNDAFLTDWIRRGLLDLRGYQMLADHLIKDREIHRAFLSVMKHQHTPVTILKMKAMSGWKDWGEYKRRLLVDYAFPRWVPVLAVAAYPLARTAFLIKRLARRSPR